nr:hypothetical protein [Vibrio parahaemolyticus]
MRLFEPIEQLEQNEELLRRQVNSLPESQKKKNSMNVSLKAQGPGHLCNVELALPWWFHHCYLGKYALLALELAMLIVSIIGLILGHPSAFLILALLVIYELPQLFFAEDCKTVQL